MVSLGIHGRWIKRIVLAGAGLVATGALATGLFWATLPPLDLSGVAERSPIVVDRHDKLLRAFTMADGRWRMPVRLQDVDPRYVSMLLAFEDKRFHSHSGVDALALIRAAGQSLRQGRIVSGGSTLTMQVARLIEPRTSRSLPAKLRQMARAIELERRFSKDDILSMYLSLAPFGGNIEGVRAATLAYLGKEPRRLSNAEAALLVALPQAPESRRPDRVQDQTLRARQRVLERAIASGIIPAHERDQALAEVMLRERRPFPALAAHTAEAALRERPDLRIHKLALDRDWQMQLETLARERAEQIGPRLAVAMVVVEHATGLVRASIGGGDYFAAERAGSMDLTLALRSPGSALKPFIYAMAFEEGLAHPNTILEDRPHRYGLYAPENFDQTFQGTVSAAKALQLSLNMPAVDVLAAIGAQRFLTRLRAVGGGLVLPADSSPGLAIALGGLGITLRDLTRLYAGLAAGGVMHNLELRDQIMEPSPTHTAPAKLNLVEPTAAWYVADALLGAQPPLNAPSGRIAYKTGTSYGYRDAWSIGFDRTHTIGVWVGRPDNGAVPGLIGRISAAPILFEAFARIGTNPGIMPKPVDALVARNAELPPPLRHMRRDIAKTISAVTSASLKLAFPPDGAQIELGKDTALTDAINITPLAIKITGGVPPFTAYLNGRPVATAASRRVLSLIPDGLGFARISIQDAQGSMDSVSVRLQ
jgi:penicillin-binding protein 1C